MLCLSERGVSESIIAHSFARHGLRKYFKRGLHKLSPSGYQYLRGRVVIHEGAGYFNFRDFAVGSCTSPFVCLIAIVFEVPRWRRSPR